MCHVDSNGGGPRSEFGLAFADNEMTITPLLRSQFSGRFTYSATPLGSTTILYFSDSDAAALVVEVEGVHYLADLTSSGVRSDVASGAESAPEVQAAAEVPVAAAISLSPVDAFTSEGAFFGSRIANLPNGKGMERGGVEFLIGHRFTFPVFDRNSPRNLFGFDSSTLVTFGVQGGLTDWMSVSAMRSNLDRTIELTSQFQLSTQSSEAPVLTQLRVAIEGRNDFTERFAPFVQFVATRSFGNRFSLSLAPSIAFNTPSTAAIRSKWVSIFTGVCDSFEDLCVRGELCLVRADGNPSDFLRVIQKERPRAGDSIGIEPDPVIDAVGFGGLPRFVK